MDTLKDTAQQALLSLIQSVADAATFLKGEIPLAVQELLTYYTALYALCVALGIAIVAVGCVVVRAILRKNYLDTDDKLFLGVMATAVTAALSAWPLSCIVHLMKIALAPRIWLLEYAASLVK